MLDEARPDTLSVVAPPLAQRQIVETALRQGIHVLCEKPMGANCEDAESMAAAAQASARVAAVNFQFRFEPGIWALREQLSLARIGAIRRIDFGWITAGRADASRPWAWQHDAALGGGVCYAFMPHVIDLLSWLSGREITRVVARTAVLVAKRPDTDGALRDVTAEDLVDALVELEGGVIANVRVTNCQHGGEGMRIELQGEKGVLRLMHRPPFSAPATVEYCWPTGMEPVAVAVSEQQDSHSQAAPLRRLAQLFVAAAQGGAHADLPSCADAVRAQRAIAALRRSASTQNFAVV